MSKRLGVVAMMLLVIASCAVVSANGQNTATVNGGYSIVPVHDSAMHPLIVYGTIVQGMTNWHTKSVSTTITSLNVNLYWGNPSNSLRLRVYSPDGYIFGPYYDSFDGAVDGRINFYINNPAGVAKGTWNYEVYGDRVTGTQAYSI